MPAIWQSDAGFALTIACPHSMHLYFLLSARGRPIKLHQLSSQLWPLSASMENGSERLYVCPSCDNKSFPGKLSRYKVQGT